jgi:hypothetical protein
MAQSKNIGHGTVLSRVTGGPTAITNVRSITPPAAFYDEVEATTLTDTVKYHMPGDPEDPGEVTMEMFWTPNDTNDELMDTDFAARTIASWKIVYASPISRTATFSAWVKSLTPAVLENNGVISRTIVFRLTTAITWS